MANEEKADKPKYTRGQYVSLMLTILLAALAWVWFNLHLKRHISLWTYGGVTTVATVAFAYGLWKTFLGDAMKSAPHRWLTWKRTPLVLGIGLALVVAAHLTTASVHLDLDPSHKAEVVAHFYRDRETEPVRSAHLRPPTQTQDAITFPFVFAPVTLRVVTQTPRGYDDATVDARMGVKSLSLPNPSSRKKYNLVRLASGPYLAGMTGIDRNYTLEVFVNDKLVRTRQGIGHETFYLGAPEGELADAVGDAHGNDAHRMELATLLAADPSLSEQERQNLIKIWLSNRVNLDTPELKDRDRVRVVLTGYGEKSHDEDDIPPAKARSLKTHFLTGVPR